MDKSCCDGRHRFVRCCDQGTPFQWKCEYCGHTKGRTESYEGYEKSYFGGITSSWDTDTMKKSEIKSFEISYTIDADRYQMISYSGHKLIYEKGWSGRITQRSCSGVEDATDWQNPLECAITEEEDKAIHCLLEKTDFESWKPTVDAMTVYVDSLIPMGYRQDLPAFRCTFNNQPYVYFKVFSCIYDIGTVLRSGSLSQIQRDVELERDIVQMLCDICKNHGIELVSITQGFRRALGMAR